ncbi:hypothetical protein ACFL59_14655, partial [Planctomycetota bacterium]
VPKGDSKPDQEWVQVAAVDEARLIEKLRLIEALFAGAATQGEQVAAERAKQRILERLRLLEQEDPPVEYRFSMGDMWSRKVFVALLRRYGIKPYRYSGQRYTTVMARASRRFVDETLWPEFQEISSTLRTYLSEVTERVVSQVIHGDSSEAAVVDVPLQLPAGRNGGDGHPTPPSTSERQTGGDASSSRQATGERPSRCGSRRTGKKRKRHRRRR